MSASSFQWDFDREAIDLATDALGITAPVEVRRRRSRTADGSCTTHHMLGTPFLHRISIDSQLSPDRASRVLWHELTHAWQAEASGDVRAWHHESRRGAYDTRPIEVEATEAEDFADDYPLVTAR